MPTLAVYIGAALAEIAGCFAFWAWLWLDKPIWWIVGPGMASLALFAYLLTLADSAAAGRAYAAYGGIYIAVSLFWLWAVEGCDRIGGTRSASACACWVPSSSSRAPGCRSELTTATFSRGE